MLLKASNIVVILDNLVKLPMRDTSGSVRSPLVSSPSQGFGHDGFEPDRPLGNVSVDVTEFSSDQLRDAAAAAAAEWLPPSSHSDDFGGSVNESLSVQHISPKSRDWRYSHVGEDLGELQALLQRYGEFCILMSDPVGLSARSRSLLWLRRVIDEFYSSSTFRDVSNLAEGIEDMAKIESCFPVLLMTYLRSKFGLEKVVDQVALDIVVHVDLFRNDAVEIELFARFLEESWDGEDLLFFLYMRYVVLSKCALDQDERRDGRGVLFATAKGCLDGIQTLVAREPRFPVNGVLSFIDNFISFTKAGQIIVTKRNVPFYEFLAETVIAYRYFRSGEVDSRTRTDDNQNDGYTMTQDSATMDTHENDEVQKFAREIRNEITNRQRLYDDIIAAHSAEQNRESKNLLLSRANILINEVLVRIDSLSTISGVGSGVRVAEVDELRRTWARKKI